MNDTQTAIVKALRSSLTEFHTLLVGYVSKDGVTSERIATVSEMAEDFVIVATYKGFRRLNIANITYAKVSY